MGVLISSVVVKNLAAQNTSPSFLASVAFRYTEKFLPSSPSFPFRDITSARSATFIIHRYASLLRSAAGPSLPDA